MRVKVTDRPMPDTYFDLVEELPLTHIRDSHGLKVAQEMIDSLLQEELDEGAQEYLDALTDLVETYEDEHSKIRDASEADVLRLLMEANGLSQPRLAAKVGIAQTTISAVLNGKRKLTRDHVVKLARFFHVSPLAFLPTS